MVTLLNRPWPYLAIAALALSVGLFAWKQPRRPGSRYVILSAGTWSVWALAAALQTVLQPLELRFGMFVLQTLCVLFESPLQLMIALEYTGNEKWLARRRLVLPFLPALIFLLAVFVLPRDAIASLQNHAGVEVLVGSDLLRRASFSFVVAVQLVIAGLFLTCLLRAPAFWAPMLLIILGRVIPVGGWAMLDPRGLTVSPIQVSVLFGSVGIITYWVALYNFHFLHVMPVARDLLILHMPYALLVLDAENRLVDLNPPARALPGLPGRLSLRQAASSVLGDWWERIAPLIGPAPVIRDTVVATGDDERIFRMVSLPLLQASGWRMGQAFVLEDVTAARRAQAQQAEAQWAQATLQEREQLADELHDGISQNLAFLNVQAQAAQLYLQSEQNEAAQASVLRLAQAAREVQGDMRELISDLLTVSLPSEGFCTTLRQAVARFEKENGLPVRLDVVHDADAACDPSVLPPVVGVQLLRIVQEALANVRKHAGSPTQVHVELRAEDGQLRLTIIDNGTGFDPALSNCDGKRFGLQVMRQRTARIGGQLAVHSAPGQGTRVEVTVPLVR